MRLILIFGALLTLGEVSGLFLWAEDQPRLDPEQPYQARRVKPVTYEVDFSVVVTAPYQTKVLRVWLPLPPSDAGQEVQQSRLSTFPVEVKPKITQEPVFGNRFAYFEFDRPQGAQIIRHRFQVKVWELFWDMEPAKAQRPAAWPSAFDKYLCSEQQIVLNDHSRQLAEQIQAKTTDRAHELAAVMRWVQDNLQYDHAAASLQASSEHALLKCRGHCSDYHGLCAALGRSLNYPTRITYGINPFPKNSPSHCKLEVYMPPYGWVSFDVSETQRLIAAIRQDAQLSTARKDELVQAAQERLFRGYRDNTWYLQTRGSDYALVPPASRKVPVIRTIYAEADGVPLPDPDPADPNKREHAWMIVQHYTPDKEVPYPFRDWSSLMKR
ncbi:MAG: transglutaminase-like domain-containing protein [Gemmataceae bacterium]